MSMARRQVGQYVAHGREDLRQCRGVLAQLAFKSVPVELAHVAAKGFHPWSKGTRALTLEAATPQYGHAKPFGQTTHFEGEPRLTDTRHAADEGEAPTSGTGFVEARSQGCQFRNTPDRRSCDR
jgi:hypothetical protein